MISTADKHAHRAQALDQRCAHGHGTPQALYSLNAHALATLMTVWLLNPWARVT